MAAGGRIAIDLSLVELDADFAHGRYRVVPGSHIGLRFADTRTGMDAATRVQVFEPFFTTKGPGGGSGMGLSMAYGFVKQSGGYIDVESEPGQGTTVVIHLPRVGAAAADDTPEPSPTPASAGPRRS